MSTNDLLFPLYCINCQNLTFLQKGSDDSKIILLDYFSGAWKKHLCSNISPELIQKDSHVQDLLKMGWGVQKIPFVYRKNQSSKRNRKFTVGVILAIPSPEAENRFLRVITPQNIIIEIKTVSEMSKICAGIVIDLSGMSRIGRQKYRIKELNQAPVKINKEQSSSTIDEFYQLTLAANDQEQLESFINRLLNVFFKQKFSPFSVVPLPITNVNNEQCFNRQIKVWSESEFLKKIENMTIPESIKVSIHQIKSRLT